jgi:hypothetical protein
MDDAVDQTMARSNDEKGADKAAALRRNQARERTQLQNEIARAQGVIAKLNEERAPIASELRKVEAEVGPIKYIAALIYGDEPGNNLLEKAVRWVIIILVLVFDPLAVMMLLAATESLKWEKERLSQPRKEEDDASKPNDNVEPDTKDMDGFDVGNHTDVQPTATAVDIPAEQWGGQDLTAQIENKTDDLVNEINDPEKQARRLWKEQNPNDTIHRQEQLLAQGQISQLPWKELITAQADETENSANVNFGTKFPDTPTKGDAYIRVDYLPTKLFKWNGQKWIEIDKNSTDTFAYNDEYIDHLIAKIGSGEYDPDLLNDNEKQQIEQRLRTDNKLG